MSEFERRQWSGMMALDAIDLSCCNKLGLELEKIWHTLSFQTLIDHSVPEHIVKRMQEENHDLFQQSPWQEKGAFFFDAILMALLAFKREDEIVASDGTPGASLSGILRDVRISGVSGFLNYTEHPEAMMDLKQLHTGASITVAGLAPEFVVTEKVIFPNGGSDPRVYDYNPHTLPAAEFAYMNDPLVLPPPETPQETDVGLAATLNLGFCGNVFDEDPSGETLTFPAVVALAKKSMGTDSAVINELKHLPFHISWHWGFSDNAHGELEAAMGLLSQSTLDFLIGCTSDNVSINAAAKATRHGVIQISPYMFTSRLERDPFPYIFRTSITSRDYAEGIVEMMRYFSWTGIGVINDNTPRGQALTDSLEVACHASEVRVRTFNWRCVPSKSCDSPEDTLSNFWETSDFRVFALAVDPNMFPLVVSATLQEPRKDRIFVAEGLATSIAALAEETCLGMQGWLSLDHSQKMNSEVASHFQKAWLSMDTASLATLGLPSHVVGAVQNLPQVYGTSPFRINTAHVLDAIVTALLAAKESMPSVKAGRFQQQSLLKAMANISFNGASGPVSFLSNMTGVGSNAGDLASAALTIRQMQKGQLARLGTVDRPGANGVPRTWRVSLHRAPLLPTGPAEPGDASEQSRSYHTLQYHASGHGPQQQTVLAQTDFSSSIIKMVVGVSVVVMVCITFPKRQESSGWARIVVNARNPSQSSQEVHHLRTADQDEEAVNDVTE